MQRFVPLLYAILLVILCKPTAVAQMEHGAMSSKAHAEAVPSKTLRLTGLSGESKLLTPDDLKALPHVSVTVTNGHSHQQETYSGVAVKDLLALVTSKPKDGKHRISPRTIIVLAGATDHFQVAFTLCDTDPGCRSGQAIVADVENGAPLATDGAFKLILTEDKMPGRWARNLDSLTERDAGSM